MESLGQALPAQIKRCQELVVVYAELGPVGAFGRTMIQESIDFAIKAQAEQDVVGMIQAYERLKAHE